MSLPSKIHPGHYVFLFLGTVIISIWSLYADPIINIDGILYIDAAKALAAGESHTAFSLYRWPFYSYLIYLMHKASGLDFVVSAHVLNALFSLVTSVAFLLVVAELGGKRRALSIAALLIVLFPGLNEVRSYIIRDHAYVAIYLLSFLLYLRAINTRSRMLLLTAMGCMAIATLFRIEGFIFLLAMPLFYLYGRQPGETPKRVPMLASIAVIIVVFVVVFGWWVYIPEDSSDVAQLSIKNIEQGWIGAVEYLHDRFTILKKLINTSSGNVARLAYLWMALGIIVVNVAMILSLPYTFLFGYAAKKRLLFPRQTALNPWKLFVYLNAGILAFFTLTRFFLTDRYPITLAVILLMTVPFALEHIYNKWRSKQVRAFVDYAAYGFLLLVIAGTCFEGLTSYSDKRYLRDSGLWLEKNIPPESKLYTNHAIVGFYSNHQEDDLEVVEDRRQLLAQFRRSKWIDYDYLAIRVSSDPNLEKYLEKTLRLVPEKVFANKHDSQVRIYNVKQHREQRGP